VAAAHEIPDFAELFLLVRFGKKLSRFLSVAPTANYPDMNGKFFAQLSPIPSDFIDRESKKAGK